jgi:transcription elongation factor GreA
MPQQVSFVTPEGLRRIQEKLDRLRTVDRPRVIAQLKEAHEQASAQADALENPELEAAKNEQAFVEGRILQLELVLKTAEVIEEPPSHEKVELGSKVTIREGRDGPDEHYQIVGSVEADPRNGFISNESPLGKALMGHRVGDCVVVSAPDGEIEFYITVLE